MSFFTTISTGGPSDQELIVQYKRSGDLESLSLLYQRYMELVYGACLNYLKEPESARDAVMQIFEELIVKLKQHDVSNFRAWLHVLSRNYCLMQLRTPRNLSTVEFDESYMQSVEKMHHEDIRWKEEALTKMEQCLEELGEAQKKAVKLFYLDQKCYKEISEDTGLEWNRVRSLIQNGRRNLKICMERNKA